MASLPEYELNEIIANLGFHEMTEDTISGRLALSDELAEIRDRGFSLNLEELSIELMRIAAPILDPTGHPIVAINVALTRPTCTEEFEETLAPLVMTAASAISERASYADLPTSTGIHRRPASKDRT